MVFDVGNDLDARRGNKRRRCFTSAAVSGPVFSHLQKATTPNMLGPNFSLAHACTVQSVPLYIFSTVFCLTLEKDLIVDTKTRNFTVIGPSPMVRQRGIQREQQ